MAEIEIDGARLAYDDTGVPTGSHPDTPSVVLVHGGTSDRRMWDRQVPVLAGRFRVVRYDWLGYGTSGDVLGDHARHEQLLALLDALGVGRAVLVGNSDGGKLSLDAALCAPEQVAGLVLVGSGLSGHVWPPEFLRLYQERIHDLVGAERLQAYASGTAGAVDPDDLVRYVEATVELLVAGPARTRKDLAPEVWSLAVEMFRNVIEREWAQASALASATASSSAPASSAAGTARDLDPGAETRLAEVSAPTLVVHGTEDVPAIIAVSELLARAIPGARHAVLPATGHVPPLECPDEFTRLLVEFLDGVAPAPTQSRS
ncbi:alpha/beta fold hydrolase [Streptacidiphilus fuscans]|uniref:Alpha/beta hydrolase n=1 Tax=Streptacidiphilus fuscans TaxID=2789292 RepID=A0A931B0V2_9ACTN|nr:alpha/beta hydrolase [Streptacidiphilus fuscans]MBF9066871.1 alpha/beta hydrolase [Streptacidiphilus fuscans]